MFLWDSGSSVGQITGHSKDINAVDYKPTRPFRICTASEDSDVGFFEGPPFKYHHANKVGNTDINLFVYQILFNFIDLIDIHKDPLHQNVHLSHVCMILIFFNFQFLDKLLLFSTQN